GLCCAARAGLGSLPRSVVSLRRRRPRSRLFAYTTLFRSILTRRGWRSLRWSGAVARGSRRPAPSPGTAPDPRPSPARPGARPERTEEHTSELQSRFDLVCRLPLEKKNKYTDRRRRAPREC